MTREKLYYKPCSTCHNDDCVFVGKEDTHEVCEDYQTIKALEQESTTKENLGVDKEQLKTMIRGLTKWYVKRDNTEVGEPNTAVGLLYDDVMFGIDRLSSVTPQEPRWISTSQRLPDIHNYSENYFVTLKRGGVYIAMFTECDEKHWWTYDDVIAWMPLPQPYSEVEE